MRMFVMPRTAKRFNLIGFPQSNVKQMIKAYMWAEVYHAISHLSLHKRNVFLVSGIEQHWVLIPLSTPHLVVTWAASLCKRYWN